MTRIHKLWTEFQITEHTLKMPPLQMSFRVSLRDSQSVSMSELSFSGTFFGGGKL